MLCLRFPSASLATAKTAFGTSPSLCAFPTHTSQCLFGDWGVRAGARESPGRPLGWQPPGPGAVPGVVAAPPAPQVASEPAHGSPPTAL